MSTRGRQCVSSHLFTIGGLSQDVLMSRDEVALSSRVRGLKPQGRQLSTAPKLSMAKAGMSGSARIIEEAERKAEMRRELGLREGALLHTGHEEHLYARKKLGLTDDEWALLNQSVVCTKKNMHSIYKAKERYEKAQKDAARRPSITLDKFFKPKNPMTKPEPPKPTLGDRAWAWMKLGGPEPRGSGCLKQKAGWPPAAYDV